MRFLHYQFSAGPSDRIVVTLDKQANVLLLDDANFQAYRQGRRYRYYGGWVKRSPFHLRPPYFAHWNVVINLGGRAGRVNASCRLVQSA